MHGSDAFDAAASFRPEANDRPTRIRVDLDALSHNFHALQARAGVPVMGIVKANAYGHGLVPVARHLQAQGIGQLGVALVEEGIALRRAGVTVPILVMGGIHAPQVGQFLACDLEVTVSSIAKLRQVEQAAASLGRQAVIHLKVDTGMERIGVHSENAGPLIEAAVASRWCTVKGIYSHLACSDDPASPMTHEQRHRFLDACRHFDRIGAPMPLRHLANSGGVLHFPDTCLDMVRPGIALYGVMQDPASRATVALKPALSLVSQVVYFKVVKAGRTVSYGATWTAPADTRVVTVPIGYGDGYPRSLEEYEQLIEEAGLGDEELYRSVKQPVLLASNAYVSGAKAASGEAEAVVSGDGSSLALRETDDELWMTVSLPESIRSATGPVISTADLGQPRIVEEYFENPDGSPIVVDRDITGAARGACSARGPLAAYGDGEVLIWSK